MYKNYNIIHYVDKKDSNIALSHKSMIRGGISIMAENRELLAILHKEVTPALGCTGPTAIAYVAAEAAEAVGGTPKKVRITAI